MISRQAEHRILAGRSQNSHLTHGGNQDCCFFPLILELILNELLPPMTQERSFCLFVCFYQRAIKYVKSFCLLLRPYPDLDLWSLWM